MRRSRGIWLGGCLFVALCLPGWALAAEGIVTPGESPDAPYTVKKGDTLWGIAKDLLLDPVLWPRIWEKNPAVTDPNRIYPGDQLTLPGKTLAPAPVQAEAPPPPPAPPPKRAEAPPPPPPPAPAPQVQAPAPAPPPAPLSAYAMACIPILTEDVATARVGTGSLVRTADSREIVAQDDRVYVGMENGASVQPGDRLSVVRQGRRLTHPKTGKEAGRMLFPMGILVVERVEGAVVLARVNYSCGDIHLGDRVLPYDVIRFPEGKIPQPATRTAEGVIVESPRLVNLLAQYSLIFVDLGSLQGIGAGDILSVFRQNPPVTNDRGALFSTRPEPIGEAVVLRVTEKSATALLTSSREDCRIGDQVVLSHQVVP